MQYTTISLIPSETYTTAYVWAVTAHGRRINRRALAVVHVPLGEGASPAALLEAVAAMVRTPVTERYVPGHSWPRRPRPGATGASGSNPQPGLEGLR